MRNNHTHDNKEMIKDKVTMIWFETRQNDNDKTLLDMVRHF